ncbi:unnamed protein product [Cercopithifilaria johnstoni]|uniref:Uncharacterized protein n=1 Tax=Cercopithifilaria johnstoni TaxID=2874296 RepID=A0A8J2ME54_9BILA|nr:unnamed protein product [Cercopithifilaria johnstoni]
MEDIVLSDVDEDQWKSVPGNEEMTTIDNEHKEQVMQHNFDHTVNYNEKEEFKETNDISDAFSISGQTSELESFQRNFNQIKGSNIRLNEIGFLNSVVKANDSEENIDIFNKSINSSTRFTNRKLSTDTNESDRLSMICIPDDDLVMKKENPQNNNIAMEIGRKNISVLEHDTEALFVRSNKMYAKDVSSSSSSDSNDIPEIIISTKNPEKILNILEKSDRMDIPPRKYTKNTKDESDDDGLIINYKNVPKNNDNLKMLTDDE